jgi:hypothetical protein
VPRQLERIVSKALGQGARAKRYQTVTDLKLDLEQLRDELHFVSVGDCDVGEKQRRETLAETATNSALPTHHRAQLETWLITYQPARVSVIKRHRLNKNVVIYSGLSFLDYAAGYRILLFEIFAGPN